MFSPSFVNEWNLQGFSIPLPPAPTPSNPPSPPPVPPKPPLKPSLPPSLPNQPANATDSHPLHAAGRDVIIAAVLGSVLGVAVICTLGFFSLRWPWFVKRIQKVRSKCLTSCPESEPTGGPHATSIDGKSGRDDGPDTNDVNGVKGANNATTTGDVVLNVETGPSPSGACRGVLTSSNPPKRPQNMMSELLVPSDTTPSSRIPASAAFQQTSAMPSRPTAPPPKQSDVSDVKENEGDPLTEFNRESIIGAKDYAYTQRARSSMFFNADARARASFLLGIETVPMSPVARASPHGRIPGSSTPESGVKHKSHGSSEEVFIATSEGSSLVSPFQLESNVGTSGKAIGVVEAETTSPPSARVGLCSSRPAPPPSGTGVASLSSGTPAGAHILQPSSGQQAGRCDLNSNAASRTYVMSGKMASLPPKPEVDMDLDWTRDIILHRDKLLGSGAAGLVYQGRFKDMDVAIKVNRGRHNLRASFKGSTCMSSCLLSEEPI